MKKVAFTESRHAILKRLALYMSPFTTGMITFGFVQGFFYGHWAVLLGVILIWLTTWVIWGTDEL